MPPWYSPSNTCWRDSPWTCSMTETSLLRPRLPGPPYGGVFLPTRNDTPRPMTCSQPATCFANIHRWQHSADTLHTSIQGMNIMFNMQISPGQMTLAQARQVFSAPGQVSLPSSADANIRRAVDCVNRVV